MNLCTGNHRYLEYFRVRNKTSTLWFSQFAGSQCIVINKSIHVTHQSQGLDKVQRSDRGVPRSGWTRGEGSVCKPTKIFFGNFKAQYLISTMRCQNLHICDTYFETMLKVLSCLSSHTITLNCLKFRMESKLQCVCKHEIFFCVSLFFFFILCEIGEDFNFNYLQYLSTATFYRHTGAPAGFSGS